MNKIILFEGEQDYRCDTLEEVIKGLIDENYYNMTLAERKNQIKQKALANSLGHNLLLSEDYSEATNTLVIKDEITYFLSLLRANKLVALEKIDANIFAKEMDKTSFENNYIILNKFADTLLKRYIENIES